MDNLLLYLLKVSAGTTLFYLCYILFFSRDTFYLRNRILLILTLVVPTILPFVRISVPGNNVVNADPAPVFESFILPDTAYVTTMAGSVNSFDYNKLFIWIYFTIAGILLLRAVISLFSTYRIISKGVMRKGSFPKVIISETEVPAFSFFPFAVISAKEYESGNYSDVLDHEFAHVRQGHTFDLLLSQLFIAFQWFNPIAWLIKRAILLNHEYLADHISISNKSIIEYQYKLLNIKTELRNISLAHNFNSLIKNRIIMINKKPTRRYAALKSMLILPVVAFAVYAFATPEYRNVAPATNPLEISQAPGIMQNEQAALKPDLPKETSLIESTQEVKKQVTESKVKTGSNNSVPPPPPPQEQRPQPIVVVDGVISDKTMQVVINELGYERGIVKMLMGKEATDKYGEKGVNGVYEIITRTKALAMGLKPPFPRLAPEDYPTFQNQRFDKFNEWVASQAKYPAEAMAKNAEGWISVNFKIELDGSVTNVVSTSGMVNPLLVNEIIRVVQSSPKWDKPKNPAVDEPFTSGITVKFKLPDLITADAPFVVVEKMPLYPGGAPEMIKFINSNAKYPEAAKAAKIEGKVFVRFVINTEGKAEGFTIMKSVHPLLDAEALRVISMLPAFTPGMQGGEAVNVWFAAPVTFSLQSSALPFSGSSAAEILKYIGTTTAYPQEARNASDTGSVYVVVKMNKGGTVQECNAYTEKNGITAPFMQEVVVVGYKPSTVQTMAVNASATKEHPALKAECLRVANKLGTLDIPEWKEKNVEFALAIKFILK
jgi:TonB family protein